MYTQILLYPSIEIIRPTKISYPLISPMSEISPLKSSMLKPKSPFPTLGEGNLVAKT
jgi:hypothetical protein